jgi:hypothetical protein
MLFAVLILELMVLYFLSRWVTKTIFMFFLLVFRMREIAVSFLLVLQFPGTVVHELAHLFTAEILGVRTGKLRLEPETIREQDILAGSVMIAESDPFRRYAIGLAPMWWGMIGLAAISFFLSGILDNVLHSGIPVFSNSNTYLLLGLSYLLFAVSNTMFPSPQDLKGFLPFAIILSFLTVAAIILGLRIALTGQLLDISLRIFTTLTQSLGVVLGINTALLILIKLLTSLISKVLRVRVVR